MWVCKRKRREAGWKRARGARCCRDPVVKRNMHCTSDPTVVLYHRLGGGVAGGGCKKKTRRRARTHHHHCHCHHPSVASSCVCVCAIALTACWMPKRPSLLFVSPLILPPHSSLLAHFLARVWIIRILPTERPTDRICIHNYYCCVMKLLNDGTSDDAMDFVCVNHHRSSSSFALVFIINENLALEGRDWIIKRFWWAFSPFSSLVQFSLELVLLLFFFVFICFHLPLPTNTNVPIAYCIV